MSKFYDPWTHTIQIFLTRLMQFFFASLLLGLSAWYGLLNGYLHVAFVEATRQAIGDDSIAFRAMLGLCLAIGALLTAWLFTWLTMRWPARQARGDRHHRGAQIIYRDDE